MMLGNRCLVTLSGMLCVLVLVRCSGAHHYCGVVISEGPIINLS